MIVIGVVTPITAIGFEVPTAPPLRPITALFACIWLFAGLGLHGLARRAEEFKAMSSGEIFITFIIPAAVLTVAYLAVLGNERAARRLDRPPGE